MGMSKESIQGYQHQEYTHLAVGAAIASGRADCGMGIEAVTQSLDLDFIPLVEERYDLIIPEEYVGQPLLEPLFEVLEDSNFRKMVAALPGYDTAPMGELIAKMP
jgi:putative molybdopterin biosynthesis protein